MKGLDILAGLTDIPASMIDEAEAPADVLSAHGYGESAESKKKQKTALIFSSGWFAAAVSAVVAVTAVVLIVLAGRNAGGIVPAGNPTEESGTRAPDTELFKVYTDTSAGDVSVPGWRISMKLRFSTKGLGQTIVRENEQSIVLSVGGQDIPARKLRDVVSGSPWDVYTFDIPADCPLGWADLVVTFKGETFTVPDLVEIVSPYAIDKMYSEWEPITCAYSLPGAWFRFSARCCLPGENGEVRTVVPDAVLTACGSGKTQSISPELSPSDAASRTITYTGDLSEQGWYDLTLVVGAHREVFPHAVKVVDESELGPFDFNLSFDDCGGVFTAGESVNEHIRVSVTNLGVDFSVPGTHADVAPIIEICREGKTYVTCKAGYLEYWTTENFPGGTTYDFPRKETWYDLHIGNDWPAGNYDVVLSYRGSSKTFPAAIRVTANAADN